MPVKDWRYTCLVVMLRTIVDSEFLLDGGAMNGIVPRVLWSKPHPPDGQGRIRLASRVTIFEEKAAGRLWLIEAGMGDGWDEKKTDIYGIKKIAGGLKAGLAQAGISPGDVTDIVLTHLHFDHATGAVTHEEGGTRLAFPDAKIHVQEKQLAWALSPSMKDSGSYRPGDIEILASCGRLVPVDGPRELSPSLSVSPFHGHTEAMQTVTIRDGDETFVVAADLVPMFSHVRIPWVMAYDNRPLQTIEEKRRFLEEAAAKRWTVISVHDALTPAAKIIRTGEDRYEAEPVELQPHPPAMEGTG
jgi:glyoxylase-like metal-dependent hydrolase (beta-lactamase superfamily II)